MKRPAVTLKLATSLDGKIALADGQSEWITGEEARKAGRQLRGEHDAIAVGSNTVILDNPQLTTRIDGEPDPIRVVFDTRLRMSKGSQLVRTAKTVPVWVFHGEAAPETQAALTEASVKLFSVPGASGVDISAALTILWNKGVKRLLLEGGGTLAASFVKAGAVDVIEWFRAPIILGADGRSGIGALGLCTLNGLQRYRRVSLSEVGEDLHERYERVG